MMRRVRRGLSSDKPIRDGLPDKKPAFTAKRQTSARPLSGCRAMTVGAKLPSSVAGRDVRFPPMADIGRVRFPAWTSTSAFDVEAQD